MATDFLQKNFLDNIVHTFCLCFALCKRNVYYHIVRISLLNVLAWPLEFHTIDIIEAGNKISSNKNGATFGPAHKKEFGYNEHQAKNEQIAFS